MKLLIAFITFLSFTSCTKDNGGTEPEPTPNDSTITELEPTPNNSRAMIVYFSCTNTTKGVAEQISELAKVTAWRIVPQVPYTSDDLNYNNSSSRANREQNDPSARPAISGKIDSISKYNVIYIGYPIWHGKAPKIIFSFLESYDFSGKTIIPFCTSLASGIGSSDTDLHSLASKAIWKQGRRFSGSETKTDIMNWINSLKLNQ